MEIDALEVKKTQLVVHADDRGNLVAIEELPFEIKRVFALSNLKQSESRANHAVTCDEFITLLSGHCQLTIKSKKSDYNYVMNDPAVGYYVPAGLWIKLHDFSENAIVLVACSKTFQDTAYHAEPQI